MTGSNRRLEFQEKAERKFGRVEKKLKDFIKKKLPAAK